jgi:hypothetical protein
LAKDTAGSGQINKGPFIITRELLLDPRVVEYGAVRIASGALKYELKDELRAMFSGKCDFHEDEYEEYLRACRKAIFEVSHSSVKEIGARLQVFFQSIMSDLEENTKNRIAAGRELRRLFGLNGIAQTLSEEVVDDFLEQTN